MKYIGRTKVGKVKTNPNTVLAIVRLPVELKEYAGKWAHIWKVDEDEDMIVVRFSDNKEVERVPSVYFGVHQVMDSDIEERLRRLEDAVEKLRRVVFSSKLHENSENMKNIAPPPGFEPGTIGLTGRRSTS